MATERLPMRHIREILRLKWHLHRTHRETARSLRISPGAVASAMSRATAIGLTWEGLEGLSDDALEQRLYGPKLTERLTRPHPDPAWIHTELRRTGVTLELLHLEYLQQHPDGYRYSAFCAHYRQWVDRQRLSMRQVHKAGEKLFVDYSGKKPDVVDPATGVVRPVELFVAVLGASNYTYAEERVPTFSKPTPGRPRPNSVRTSFRVTARRWSISPAFRPSSCPISSARGLGRRVATNRRCNGPTQSGRSITARRFCLRDRAKLGIKRKSRWAYWWPSGGSSRACAMRRSFPSPR